MVRWEDTHLGVGPTLVCILAPPFTYQLCDSGQFLQLAKWQRIQVSEKSED